jgi:membrane protein
MLIWIYITWWLTLAGAVIVANLPTIRQNRPPEQASA